METESTKKEGPMSSEELDEFTAGDEQAAEETTKGAATEETTTEETPETVTETDLAKEALKATETPAEESEEQVPAAVVGDLRRKTRAAELEAAELRGRLEATEAARTQVATPKSPMELAAEEQGVSVDEVEMTGALYREQRAWEDRQQTDKASKTAADERASLGQQSIQTAQNEFSIEKAGAGLDYHTVTTMGQKYLTRGDAIDIAEGGAKAAHIAYKRCLERTLESGTQDAQTLRTAITAHKKAQPKQKTGDAPAKIKQEQPSQPTNEEDEPEVRASTEQIISDLGMFE